MTYDELQERWFEAYPVEGDQLIPTKVYGKNEVDEVISELKDIAENACLERNDNQTAIDELTAENSRLNRALWAARASAAKFWANYWFDVAPSEHIKYDRIGRMEGVEKEFILTKVTKHMTASDWVGLWEKIERLCRHKSEEYK